MLVVKEGEINQLQMTTRPLKLCWKEVLLFLIPLFVLGLPLLYKALNQGDRLDKAQRKLAGAGAIDCGVGHPDLLGQNSNFLDRDKVDACAVAAYLAKKPFLARFNEASDSGPHDSIEDSTGVVGTPKGEIYWFYYHNFSRGWNRSYDFRKELCKKPKVVSVQVNNQKWKALGCEVDISP